MAHLTVTDEQYIFRTETRNKFLYVLGFGILFFVIGLILAMNDKGHDAPGQGEEHGMVKTETLVASTVADQQHDQEHKPTQTAAGQGHHKKGWKERLYTSLWMNNV